MNEGRLIQKNTSTTIMDEIKGKVFEAFVDEDKLKDIQEGYKVCNIMTTTDGIYVRFLNDSEQIPESFIANVTTPNLEDVYLHYFE